MKSLFFSLTVRRFAACTLIVVHLLGMPRANATGEVRAGFHCGALLAMAIGLGCGVVGCLSTGGSAGAMLANERGLFESDSAFEARKARNRETTYGWFRPAGWGLGTGLALLALGFAFPDTRLFRLKITGFPQGAFVSSTDGTVRYEGGAATIELNDLFKPKVYESIFEVFVRVENGYEVYPVQVFFTAGQEITISLAEVKKQVGKIVVDDRELF